MERAEVLDMMSSLKLYGMRSEQRRAYGTRGGDGCVSRVGRAAFKISASDKLTRKLVGGPRTITRPNIGADDQRMLTCGQLPFRLIRRQSID